MNTISSSVTAVILAGGLGTRLRPVVSDRPKALARVGDKPFMDYILAYLSGFGLTEVVICTGYLGEQIRERYGSRFKTLNIRYAEEKKLLGTGGAVRNALPLIHTAHALVLNGDSMCCEDMDAFYKLHINKASDASIIVVHKNNAGRYGSVVMEGNNRIHKFEEKNKTAKSGWVNAGIYLIKKECIQSIPADRHISIEKEVFPLWIRKGLVGFKSTKALLDIGTPESYATAERILGEMFEEAVS